MSDSLRRHLTRRRIVIGGIGLAVIGAIVWALLPDPIDVEAEPARLAPVRVTVAAEGETRVRERYVVAAPVTGRLQRIRHEEGAWVERGEVVARLAPTPLDEPDALQAQARLDAAVARRLEADGRVRAAVAARQQAIRERDRQRMLYEWGAAARRDVEQAELALTLRTNEASAARMEEAAARAAIREAGAALLRAPGASGQSAAIEVRAPARGRVLRVPDESERVVTAGTPLLELGDLGGLEVVADMLSSDAARVVPGMRAIFTGWGGSEALTGHVRLVEPSAATRTSALGVAEQRVNVVIDPARVPPTLGDRFRVDVEIIVEERASVVTVPPGALLREGASWAVFVVDHGRARLRPVQVGAMGESAVEIVEGVRLGESVIVFPSDETRDGVRVRVRT